MHFYFCLYQIFNILWISNLFEIKLLVGLAYSAPEHRQFDDEFEKPMLELAI